jgi:hypothetical protein
MNPTGTIDPACLPGRSPTRSRRQPLRPAAESCLCPTSKDLRLGRRREPAHKTEGA